MEDFQLTLFDRLEVIKLTNERFNLLEKSYISLSGGKDSTILHYLIDEALPGNKIPRVFIDTGIEFAYIREFIMDLASKDDRIVIIKPTLPIKSTLEKYGYPFKSKPHSHYLKVYQNSGMTNYVKDYVDQVNKVYKCPTKLTYQFTSDFKIKCSEKCCIKMKEQPSERWSKTNHKTINLTGVRKEEGGARSTLKGCIFVNKKGNIKFHPLFPVTEEWEDWYIKKNNIKLCKLYYPPFNFTRTGCKGCPNSKNLQKDLDTMQELLPNERKQCEYIWKPIYDEYRRIGYRLRKKGEHRQLNLFDLIYEVKE